MAQVSLKKEKEKLHRWRGACRVSKVNVSTREGRSLFYRVEGGMLGGDERDTGGLSYQRGFVVVWLTSNRYAIKTSGRGQQMEMSLSGSLAVQLLVVCVVPAE